MGYAQRRGFLRALSDREQAIEDHVADLFLHHFRRSFVRAVGADQRDDIGIDGETGVGAGDVVADDQVESSCGAACRARDPRVPRSRRRSQSSCGRPCAPRIAATRRRIDASSSVIPRGFFLSFCAAGLVGRKSATAAAITSAEHQGKLLRDRVSSISSALTVSTRSTPCGVGERRRARDDANRRPATPCRARDREAHLAGRSVGDEAHRIDRLLRRSGGDQDALTGKVLRRQHPLSSSTTIAGSDQTSLALVTASERARAGIDNRDAARAQLREVLGDGRMVIHVHVHRGREGDGTSRGEQHGRHDVVGDSAPRPWR